MNWIKIINDTLEYIEDHINDPIDLQKLAERQYVSYFHFSKIFSAFCEIPLSEYIRNRRLSLAASDLLHSNKKIIDISLNYQYETPEAFSRAFKRFHNVSPTVVRKSSVTLQHYPKISFQILKKGESLLEYKIKKSERLYFLGKSIRVTKGRDELKERVPSLWHDTMNNGGFDKLKKFAVIKRPCGVVFDIDPINEHISYFVGVETKESITLDGYETITIEPATFATFECEATSLDNLHKLKKEVFTSWSQDSSFEFAPVAEIEFYSEELDNENRNRFEYWISIE